MMIDGDLFGPQFIQLDGYNLEFDDEFAFTLFETREEWESERELMGICNEDSDEDPDESTSENEPAARKSDPDEFSSVWRGFVSDEPIPGDVNGHLKLAFLFAEIIAELRDLQAPDETIMDLNECFRRFRKGEVTPRSALAADFKAGLEELVPAYPRLTSRVADLQSRVDESILEQSRR